MAIITQPPSWASTTAISISTTSQSRFYTYEDDENLEQALKEARFCGAEHAEMIYGDTYASDHISGSSARLTTYVRPYMSAHFATGLVRSVTLHQTGFAGRYELRAFVYPRSRRRGNDTDAIRVFHIEVTPSFQFDSDDWVSSLPNKERVRIVRIARALFSER